MFCSQAILAVQVSSSDVYKIQGVVGEYLGFSMADVNAENCRQGAPDWPKVEGLPAGMYSSGCSIYGEPESTGTTRIEFPIESGVWPADIVVVSSNSEPDPDPDPEPDPDPDTEPDPTPTPIPANPATSEAARFLNQASFGANTDAINHLLGLENYESWIDEQFNTTPSLLLPGTHAIYQAFYEHCISNSSSCPASLDEIKTLGSLSYVDTEIKQSRFVWWANAIDGADQLRQRIAFALSEILVVSDIPIPLRRSQFGVASYYDMLIQHSFGNYRDLLEAVSLHPVMGMYLSHVQNEKADPERNIRPDENYARELLQLFSIGVHQLNLDGTLIEDADGKPKATYGQAEIQEFAKVFTGWNFADLPWGGYYSRADRTMPMEPNEAYHDDAEKRLFNNVVLPAGQTARQDLEAALNNIFEHPNVGPFISKQLIQRLVTSNPTPAYVSRVASIFNNNGAGVRGDMKAVIKAILLDSEARTGQSTITDFGKMREPVLRISHVWRAFNATKTDNTYFEWQVPPGVAVYSSLGLREIAQEVLRSPSVFNFFQPSHSPAGPVRDAGLVAPEFQIATENVVMRTTNIINSHIQSPQPSEPRHTYLNLDNEIAIAVDLNTLLDHLNILLMSGSMSEALHGIIYTHLTNANFPDGVEGTNARVRDAITLIINSPEYLIQK